MTITTIPMQPIDPMQPVDPNEELIAAHKERLRVLELQAARYGNDAPPHIVTEISKIVAVLRALTTVADLTPNIDPNAPREDLARDQIERRRDASTNEQATLRMIATIQATVSEVSNVKSTLRQEVSTLHDQVDSVRSEVREQLDDAKERVNEQIASIEQSVANVQTVVLTEVQGVHTTIDRVIKNGLRTIGIGVLVIGVIAIVLILYFRA